MSKPPQDDLGLLIGEIVRKLEQLDGLNTWLRASGRIADRQQFITQNVDEVIERGKLLLGEGKDISGYQNDAMKWDHITTLLKDFLIQLTTCYDEVECLHALCRETVEGGNPYAEKHGNDYSNPCEALWADDEIACANSVRLPDDTE